MSSNPADFPGFERLEDRRSTTLDRREFLGFIGATLAAGACGDVAGGAGGSDDYPSIERAPSVADEPAPRAPNLPNDPFQLGVACGDPLPEGFVLWTRLAPDPMAADGGMPDLSVPVTWEVARDENFDELVGRDWMHARTALAHSVHIDVRGLQPDTWYWYRFRVGDQWTSPVGRARTFPRHDASPDRLKMAIASCQNYTDGYYTAHAHMAEEDLDLVAFLGDYIYENGYGSDVRRHPSPALETVEQFRRRYALYKSDPNLQAAHANCPWIFTWDDHEVRNNYAGDESHKGRVEDFKRLRAAAYRAYFEHMPLRVPLPNDTSSLEIYRSLQFGDLVRLYVLDGRQYRSGVICNGEVEKPCDEIDDPEESMLGDEQYEWLLRTMGSSSTTWNAICQQTVFSPTNLGNSLVNHDQWDGFQAERQRLLDFFRSDRARNVTVLTGDIHMAAFLAIPADDDDPENAPTVGHEIVTTSISSGSSVLGNLQEASDAANRLLEYLKYLNPGKRGYCMLEYEPDECTVRYRGVSTVERREAEVSTDKTFVIEADTGQLRDTS